jgi:hypothetical protein
VDTEPNDEQSTQACKADAAAEASAQSQAKLRALLDGVELAPSQTSDDIAPKVNRDSEILRDVPPHHG